MADNKLRFDTLKVRGGYDSERHNYAVSVPIYQTAGFDFGNTARGAALFSLEEQGYLYTRVGNPTVEVLEQRVAALDGASGAVALASGMAAVSYTLLNVAEGGGRILTTPHLYGGTVDGLKKLFPKLGITIDVSDQFDFPEALEQEILPDTKAIFVESISNPNGVVADIEGLAQVAHRHGIPLIVDNTFATPYLLNPIRYGADIVIYSATKALNGHGNAIAGLVLEQGGFKWDSGRFPQFEEPYYTLRDATGRERTYLEALPDFPFTGRIRLNYLNYFGAALSPFDAYLVLLGLETLSERVGKQVGTAEKLVRYLESHDRVAWVKHPAAKGSPYRQLADRYLPRGAGAIFTFGLKATVEEAESFIDATRVFSYHANVGDSRSLIINPAKTTHSELTPAEQRRGDIQAETIRLSIGLEDPDDLIEDLEQAFAAVFPVSVPL
ncbi:MAG: O-acetyl-L-homoserine sulfhydrylase-related protein [Paenibacillaceae bacterium]|jgi:O-acetylhomoserine (thiol)-lyase|nr:O-acetyl-L-homoserine sulfhydrylase-related protein [Paenibacillaceae bacterium]